MKKLSQLEIARQAYDGTDRYFVRAEDAEEMLEMLKKLRRDMILADSSSVHREIYKELEEIIKKAEEA